MDNKPTYTYTKIHLSINHEIALARIAAEAPAEVTAAEKAPLGIPTTLEQLAEFRSRACETMTALVVGEDEEDWLA